MENTAFVKNISQTGIEFCETADSFLQSAMWGRFKSRFGWKPFAFNIEWGGGETKPLLVLFRRIAPGFAMAYVPWGPELPSGFSPDPAARAAAVTELARALRRQLPRNTVFIRFDPPWFAPGGDFPPPPVPPLKKAAAGIQPPDTVIISLEPPEEKILAAMKPKWRYNIALAEKRGVTVSEGGTGAGGLADSVNDIDIFYQLLRETAARDGISVHSIEYYRSLFDECVAFNKHTGQPESENKTKFSPLLRLYTAAHEGVTLAAVIVLFRGKRATYLYGASSNIKRNLMAAYALQWKAMRDAKALGCVEYDLFGIPPTDDPAHPMAGLYRFKTGFGGGIIHRPGSWDFPCRPLLYTLFSFAERLRKKSMDRKKTKK